MHLLIDGHNLIGSNLFDDIHLSDEDDEAKLVMRLKVWQGRARRPGGSMTVIFDRGIPGGIDVKMGGGGVHVVFAADPAQADDLIRRRLRQARKGLVLVTNDEGLIQEARAYGVRHWRGDEFVARMRVRTPEVPEAGTESDVQVSKAEVEEWLALFRARQEARKAQRLAKRKAASVNGDHNPAGKQAGKPRGLSPTSGKSPQDAPPAPTDETARRRKRKLQGKGKPRGKRK